MELYIQLRGGQPYLHPIHPINFKDAFPDVDRNNLPNSDFAKFIRKPAPEFGIREKLVEKYIWDGDVVTDDWSVEQMTEQEIVEADAATSLGSPDTTSRASCEKEVVLRVLAAQELISSGEASQRSKRFRKVFYEYLEELQQWEYDENNPTVPTMAPIPVDFNPDDYPWL